MVPNPPPSTLLFIPLDDRPVTRGAVLDLAAAAGIALRTPDRTILGSRTRAADVHALWAWIHGQVERFAPAACIASIEMLCFGGLVASRTSQRHWRNLLPWLDQVYALAGQVPAYLSAVIPRTPVHGGGDEDPHYWETHGEALRAYSIAADQFGWMGDAAAGGRVTEALERLPASVIEAVLQHRRRHLLLNAELLIAAVRGSVRALLIGQDDTTAAGLSRIDREALERLARVAGASNAMLTTGADELGAVLFARWLNEMAAHRPAVRVAYTFPNATDRVPAYESTPLAETVREHIEAAGCRVVTSGEEILLWVHNFDEERQREARDQSDAPLDARRREVVLAEVRAAAEQERVVALADVRFANGADASLVSHLLQRRRSGGIAAYAGWNTASNSLGSAVAQAVTVFHLRQFNVPGDDRAAWHMLLTRLLDDWGYQVVARPRLTALVHERGDDPTDIETDEASLGETARRILEAEVLPALRSSFGLQLELTSVTFPWHRLFEAAIEFELPARARPKRTLVIAEYDPRWPALFAEEKARILRAAGEIVVAVEHVGSTAVEGLGAKPIIDITVGVRNVDDLDRIVEPLQRLGYEYEPMYEMSLPERRYFRKNDARGVRTHHVHVVPYGGPFWQRHLVFRDYLRAHPSKAREYDVLKRQLAAQHQSTTDYTYAKTAFIRSVEKLAVKEERRQG